MATEARRKKGNQPKRPTFGTKSRDQKMRQKVAKYINSISLDNYFVFINWRNKKEAAIMTRGNAL